MAKEITGYVKLQCKGGQANPAPPIGPALGSKGINIMEFCKQFCSSRFGDKNYKTLNGASQAKLHSSCERWLHKIRRQLALYEEL
jgi:hypothetical protein